MEIHRFCRRVHTESAEILKLDLVFSVANRAVCMKSDQ